MFSRVCKMALLTWRRFSSKSVKSWATVVTIETAFAFIWEFWFSILWANCSIWSRRNSSGFWAGGGALTLSRFSLLLVLRSGAFSLSEVCVATVSIFTTGCGTFSLGTTGRVGGLEIGLKNVSSYRWGHKCISISKRTFHLPFIFLVSLPSLLSNFLFHFFRLRCIFFWHFRSCRRTCNRTEKCGYIYIK